MLPHCTPREFVQMDEWPHGAVHRASPWNVVPGLAFPKVGPLGLGSPLSRSEAIRPAVLCAAKTAVCPSQVASLSLASRYLVCFLRFVSRCRLACWWKRPTYARAFIITGPLFRCFNKETDNSLQFPSHPCVYMPRSQTPVVSLTHRHNQPRTAAFR